jgi:hypothetical protein
VTDDCDAFQMHLRVHNDKNATKAKQHTDDTQEPVFFHSLPESFWTAMLDAFNIIGVIDLCAGEGTCAMACFRKLIPYCGITFNDQHSARLLAYLEKTILSKMTVTGDSLFDVRFANAVAGERATSAFSDIGLCTSLAKRLMVNLSRATSARKSTL